MFAEKHRRTAISLERKIQILDRLATGEGSTAVGRYFGISEATVRSIKKSEIAIRTAVYSGIDLSAKSTTHTKDPVMVKTEAALVMWIEENEILKLFPLDGITIKTIALMIYSQIKEKKYDQLPESKRNHEFFASNGWLRGFLRRNGLDNIKMKNESFSGNIDISNEEYKDKLNDIIEQVCTADHIWIKDGGDDDFLHEISNIAESPSKRKRFLPRKKERTLDSNKYVESAELISSNHTHSEVQGKCQPIATGTKQAKREQERNDIDTLDPLYMNFIEEGMKLANAVSEHFLEHDWNKKRARKFQRDLTSLLNNYNNL